MFNKPFFIAIFTTALACIPLYLISSQQYTLTTGNFPLIAVSLFIVVLIAVFWSNTTAAARDDQPVYSNPGAVRETGNVKWFNASKGFGFITRDSGDDIFVHFRSIRGKGHRVLQDGQRVEFAVSAGEKGLQADDVAAAQ
ncbi:MAG: cold-shock protein [Gammaproteobacteria bacterium]|jgi:CspA family cold shock protein|nr:cold-shock protein [Gammaproteobacteria bacterium]